MESQGYPASTGLAGQEAGLAGASSSVLGRAASRIGANLINTASGIAEEPESAVGVGSQNDRRFALSDVKCNRPSIHKWQLITRREACSLSVLMVRYGLPAILSDCRSLA
jgi:hypothetical protein